MIHLVELSKDNMFDDYNFFQSFPSGNGFINNFYNCSFEEYEFKVTKEINNSKGINLDDGKVKQTIFILKDDDKYIGMFKVRPCLTETLKNGPGHIGYGIHPQYRRCGYATKGLGLAIEELKKIKDFIDGEIYLSCYKFNIASYKVMEKNGGYIHHSDNDCYYVRINR